MTSAVNIFYVPWADSSEWNTVRKQMFSADINDTIKAYQTILMWRLKYYSIPAYIECTYSLLQVMIKEYEMSKSETSVLRNENDLQVSYSMALVRFVNHVLSISSYKGLSLYLAARTQNIPDWIINMRHDVSHGQDLPTLDALHQAAELSLQWLLDNYWANEESEERSLHLSQFDLDFVNFEAVDVDIQNFFKKVLDLWELCQSESYCNVEYIMEADREFMLQVEDVFDSCDSYFNTAEIEVYTDIKKIINIYKNLEKNGNEKCAYKFSEFKICLFKFLKGIIKANPRLKHLLVLSLLETSILLENGFDPSKWQDVLHLLQHTDSFKFFLEILFELAGKGHKGATKWLSALAPSIKCLKKQWAVFKMINREKKNLTVKAVKKKIRKTVKPDPNVMVTLDICKPPVLTLQTMKSCLLNPEHFSLEDISQYLNFVKPPLLKETLDKIIEIVSLQKGSDNKIDVLECDKIYTVEDLNEVLVSENNLVVEKASGSNGWTKTSIDSDAWNKCPLGLLPFQSKVDCTLPSGLKWKKSRFSQKTLPVPLLKHGITMKKMLEI